MKIELIRAKLETLELGQTIGPFEIDIAYISQDPTFQVRAKLDQGNIDRLKAAYKAETDVAPIRLAVVPGRADQLFIVDGHHRVTALEIIHAEQYRNGSTAPVTVKASIEKLEAPNARWQAAAANMSHGQRITNKEWRKAFQRYVEAGQHLNPDGSRKSYREIGSVFGKTHPTMMSWMLKDFPQEARQMTAETTTSNAGGQGIPAPIKIVKHTAMDAIRTLGTCFDGAFSGERDEIIEALYSLLDDMERVKSRTDTFMHDENLRYAGHDHDPEAEF